jgi:uncharacterized membrane protein YfcA
MLSAAGLAIAWLVCFLAALVQGSIGFGFAVLAVPLLTLIDPQLTPIPQLFLALPITVAAAWRERDHLELSGLGWIVAGRVPGSLVGAWILTRVSEQGIGLVIAAITLAAVLVVASGVAVPLTRTTRLAAGLASGFSGTTSAIGGPPVALLYQRSAGEVVRANLGAIFTIGLLINLAALFATGAVSPSDYRATGLLAAPVLAGFALSGRLARRLDPVKLRQAILALSGVAAVALLVDSLA